MSVRKHLNQMAKKKFLLFSSVFFLSFASIVYTIDDYGLSWDEPYYIVHSEKISKWFGKLIEFDAPFSRENYHEYWNYDRFHNCHPPFYKLSGIFLKNLIGRFFFHNIVYRYRVSTAFWASVFLAFLSLYFFKVCNNMFLGIVGSCTFLSVPRFFAHTHFFATDIMIAALGFITLYLFYDCSGNAWKTLFSSAFTGALLATKFTGIMIFPIALSFVFVSKNKKRFLINYLIFTVLACIFFIIFNPHAWFGILKEVSFYFKSVLDRERIIPIPTLYWGKVYNYRLPWHHPFVMFGITLPVLIVVFAIPGIAYDLANIKDKTLFFEIVPFILLFAVFLLPNTPKHDGIRLFSMAWPFIIILFVRGTSVCSECLAKFLLKFPASIREHIADFNKLPVTAMAILIMLNVLFSLASIHRYHPYELSYYNKFINGPPGAVQKGFTISYWCEALNKDSLTELSDFVKDKAIRLYSYPKKDILKWNRYFGLLDDAIDYVSTVEKADYLLILNRKLPPERYRYLSQIMVYPIVTLPDNTLVLWVGKNDTRPEND